MARPIKYSDDQIIDALKKRKGMIYLAANLIGCEADTIYNRAKKSKRVAEAIKAERGKIVDLAEMKLAKAVSRSEPWSIMFALKMLGKDRGYVEKQEIETTDKVTLEIVEEIVRVDGEKKDQANGQTAPEAV